jgi:hypothetical protein
MLNKYQKEVSTKKSTRESPLFEGKFVYILMYFALIAFCVQK